METGTLAALAAYFIAMLGIGIYAMRKSTSDSTGYLLGGRNLSPPVAALSAGASDMSGWLLMGLPGAVFLSGLGQVWIGIGVTIGALLNYLYVAPRLRSYTELANNAITVPDFFEERFHDKSHVLRMVSAAVIIIFFTLYTMAMMVAAGKLGEAAMGMSYTNGILVIGAIVVAYTFLGGFLAVSLTDFVQGCIMFVALVLVPIIALTHVGDLGAGIAAAEANRDMAAGAMNAFIGDMTLLAIISTAAWGLGYFGQPHIIVRFMAVRSVKDVPLMRNINMTWMVVSLIGAIAVGYIGAAFFAIRPDSPTDAETVFIDISRILFHPLIFGFIIAAILAAIMSTISSQLLVASSSLAEDLYHTVKGDSASEKELVTVSRIAVVLVALVAGWMALTPNDSILGLVGNAWAGFGAAFGPVILFSLLWKRTTRWGALAGMLSGAGTVALWIYYGLSSEMYEIVPGFIVASIATYVVSLMTAAPGEAIEKQFDEAARIAEGA